MAVVERNMAKKESYPYLIVWEFHPKKGEESQFEQAYGANGVWATFFKKGEGFIATQLNRDLKDPTRYLTFDLWMSRQAYEAFCVANHAEYDAIDAQCKALTESERELGSFERL